MHYPQLTCILWILLHPSFSARIGFGATGQTLVPNGGLCVGDSLGSQGTCMDRDQIPVCGVLPGYSVSQGNCASGSQCCYFNSASMNPSPGINVETTTTTISPWLTTPSSFFTFPPQPWSPIAATTINPWQTTLGPIIGGGRRCGRLQYSDVTSNVASSQVSISLNLPPGFQGALLRNTRDADRKNQRQKRIVGGEPVAEGDLCYQIAVVAVSQFQPNGQVIASGALLSEDYAITSYSAINRADPLGNGQNIRVIPGGVSNLNAASNSAFSLRVLRVVRNPGFLANVAPGFPVNDIALIQLDRSGAGLDWSRVCTVCLPTSSIVPSDCKRYFVSGYGTTSEGSPVSDGLLRRVSMSTIPQPVCQNAYRAAFRNIQLDPNALCAGGEGGRDTCNRDGGAPLVCETFNTGERYLVGIASWGYGCGRPGFPGVYTNVTGVLPWIQQTTRL